MKNLMMVALAMTVSVMAFAQGKNVTKAENAMKAENFSEAVQLIEPATTHEKTKDKGRTWYVRGQIYSKIALSPDPATQSIDPEAAKKAVESFDKVKELEKEGTNYYMLADLAKGQLLAAKMNKGVEAYQNDDYEAALEAFKEYTEVAPDDTTGYIYAAIMAGQLEKYDEVVELYQKVFDLGYYPKDALNVVIYYLNNQLDQPEKALEYVKLAEEKYPDDLSFRKTEIDILVKLNKVDDAIKNLQGLIEKEPDNAMLYSFLGLMYDAKGETEKAMEQYKKALEINPNDKSSLINLAVFYINRGDEINKKAIEMDVATYNKKGAAIEAQAKEEWAKAVPLLEKVLENEPEDALALQNLQAVYVKMKEMAKAQEILNKRKELGLVEEQ
ncbi:MAG TPA: tetratricopeptide repeat protein [Flammeovirgaceae bacterium]|nr:tetratricopeptide repeat protein [Flammeovirgaceae bacterium]